MKDLPQPHINDSWPPDITQDYVRASGDDERRRIILAAGYDKAHRADAVRLFPGLIKKRPEELKGIIDSGKYKRKKLKPQTFGDFMSFYGVIIAVVGIAVVLLIHYHVI